MHSNIITVQELIISPDRDRQTTEPQQHNVNDIRPTTRTGADARVTVLHAPVKLERRTLESLTSLIQLRSLEHRHLAEIWTSICFQENQPTY